MKEYQPKQELSSSRVAGAPTYKNIQITLHDPNKQQFKTLYTFKNPKETETHQKSHLRNLQQVKPL